MKNTLKQNTIVPFKVAFIAAFLCIAAALCADTTNTSMSSLKAGKAKHPRSRSITRTGTASARPASAHGHWTLEEVGPDHKTWTLTSTNAQPNWHASSGVDRGGHRVVEIATGMNYFDGQNWIPSVPSFEITADAFVAQRIQHKAKLNANNLNAIGAVTVTTPDGIVLRSTPVGIGLYDAASGESAILAGLRDCSGVLVSSNQVVYENAFNENGVQADVVYTIGKGFFEQDIVFRSRLNPADYGFPTNSTRIQVFTEFYGAPQPDRIVRPIRVEPDQKIRKNMLSPDLVDEILGFGEFVFATGRSRRADVDSASGAAGAPIVKMFTSILGRTFLIESVEFSNIRDDLGSLPDSSVKNGSAQPRRVKKSVGYAAIPSPRSTEQANASPRQTSSRLAKSDNLKHSGVVVDYLATIGGTVNTATVFQGDTTYFVNGEATYNGSVTIEGGAVFKFPNSTGSNSSTNYIKINTSLTCKTSNYRPAIFTAGDDENIGESLWETWSGWSGDTTGKYYACPALWIYNLDSTTLSNLRFSFCQEAVRIDAPATYQTTISHAQLVSCIRGVVLTGNGSGSGSGSGPTLTINNSLMSNVQYPLTLNTPNTYGNFYQCTVDNSVRLISANASSYTYSSVNSIIANVPALYSGATSLSGNCNGFYPSTNPQFGSNPKTDDEYPFAPTGYTDENGNPHIFFANGQGAYYLREESPFFDVGTAGLPSTLKSDLGQRTTIPPTIFFSDVFSPLTLGRRAIRDTDAPDLGYHYPGVDYAINGATVNNSTLNIDAGTVLALFGGDFEWGIRLNPGARLNVVGVPTNHVMFARLEAVQEQPTWLLQPWAPLISWKAIYFVSGPATPLPEAKFRYADFPTLSEDNWNVHFGNLQFFTDISYMHVGGLELDGCLFQGGAVLYMSGSTEGPARTLNIRNTVFERTDVFIKTWGGTYPEQLTAANNLFYNCYMLLWPVSGANWTFIDNIFDHVTLDPDNGDVAVNNHNAYVGMSGARLSPAAPTSTDPDLASLTYQTGSLGRFYLPTSATLLIDKGSRSVQSAGLFHFTSLTTNAKEGDDNDPTNPRQVDIGPHYVALASGKPKDYDADGLPDYVEDANGDGVAQNSEANWRVKLNIPIRIVPSVEGSVVSGIASIPVDFDNSAVNVQEIQLSSPVGLPLSTVNLSAPFGSRLEVEWDTRSLPNGSMALQAKALLPDAEGGGHYTTVESDPVTVTVQNDLNWPEWEGWTGDDVALINFSAGQAALDYTVYVYEESDAYSMNPSPVATIEGHSGSGVVYDSFDLVSNGVQGGNEHPSFFSIAETQSGGASSKPRLLPPYRQSLQWPLVGAWYVAYEDSFRQVYAPDGTLQDIKDLLQPYSSRTWFHEGALDPGWLGTASYQAPGNPVAPRYYIPPQPNGGAQSWPIRYCNYMLNEAAGVHPMATKEVEADWGQFALVVSNPDVRNLYIGSHMSEAGIGPFRSSILQLFVKHRYHFVFLDGCASLNNALIFGFQKAELDEPKDIGFYRGTGFPRPRLLRPAGGVAFWGRFQFFKRYPPGTLGYVGYIASEYGKFYIDFQSEWTIALNTAEGALV